ncbi:MAG: hypothetical protein KAU12_03610 [Candidatus Omnitrophica bacterium]|nr:hypothetical protein [Candidatus Omnitrophota bacterium]
MEKVQVLLNLATIAFLLAAGVTAFIIGRKKRNGVWFFTSGVFVLSGVNKIFDFDNIVGGWFLGDGIEFINWANRTLPWLKLYKQPGFIVDFFFLIAGVLAVLALNKRMKRHILSYSFFAAGVVSFLGVIFIGFCLAGVIGLSIQAGNLQAIKDTLEAAGALCFLAAFLSYR